MVFALTTYALPMTRSCLLSSPVHDVEHSVQHGLQMNVAKTEIVIFSKTSEINNAVVQQVSTLKMSWPAR